MRRHRGLLVLLLAALVASPVAVLAQGPGGPAGERGPGGGEALRMIDAYVISNLQESLGLTDDQFGKLVPLVKRLQTERREAMRTRMKTLQEMRRLLESGSATESQVLERLAALKALESEEPRRGQQTMEAIDAQLSPLQQAKFRVFEAEVGLKVRELMAQMRGERRPPGARRERKDAPPQ